MDFKCFNMKTRCVPTLGVLVRSSISLKMYLSLVIFTLLLLFLWIYIIFAIKHSFVSNTSIEVNIIDNQPLGPTTEKVNVSNESDVAREKKNKIRNHVPKFMLELYEQNKIGGKKDGKPDLVRSLIPSQAEKLQGNDILEELSENHLLIFDLPTSNKDERFIGAVLRILTQVEINSVQELGVKKELKISVYDESIKQFSYLKDLKIHHFNNTWLSFDLTDQVNEILQIKSDKKFLKVIVTVSSFYHHSKNNLKLSLLPVIENFEHDYPILLLSYSLVESTEIKKTFSENGNGNVKRTKRNVEDDYEEETNKIWKEDFLKRSAVKKFKRNNCKKRPFYINFAEIEYDLWIVQPSGYEAYQCQGRCFYPVAEHLSPTKHAIMQALMHSVNPSKASRSCCVPTVLDSISILYVDDKGVLTYRYAYKDMVVVECGCR